MKKTKDLTYLTRLSLLVAIMFVMNITGLGMIPLPGQYASIMTVPIAVGAMILGPLAGAILGGVMGCFSYYTAIRLGFASLFTIGYSGFAVPVLSFLNTVPTRILMGYCTGLIFQAVKKLDKTKTISYYIGGLCAPILNTIFYMSVLVVVYKNAPHVQALLSAELFAKFEENALLFVAAYVGIQAVLEAGVGCVISGSVAKVLRLVVRDK